ncbi:MAG: HigA family addiction module antitoxin [Rhizomicrobium sp.]
MVRKSEPLFAPERPGDVLKRYILNGAQPITQDELAKAMGVSRLTINQLVRGKRAVTAVMALRLARVLSTTPDFWLNLQREVDLFEARKMVAGQLKGLPILRRAQLAA